MSGYLMRLAMRTGEISQAQSMQPFVRTTSPVAEHDQRIGMMGFEAVELGDASLAEADVETGAEPGEMLQPPVPSGITTTREAAAAAAQIQAHIQPSAPWAARGAAPAPSKARRVNDRAQQPVLPGSEVGALDLADAHDGALSPSAPPIVSRVSSTDGIHPEALSPGDSQTESAARRVDPGIAPTRPMRQTRQVDATHLEPSRGALAGHLKLPLAPASEVSTEASEGPRVVIGRINVEVVPPPAAPPSATAPRPGPLTAASASVIGPLGSGIRPSLRLSLRHR